MSPLQMLQSIVKNGGVLGLWSGMSSQLLNACLANAILFSSKEKIQAAVRRIMLAMAK